MKTITITEFKEILDNLQVYCPTCKYRNDDYGGDSPCEDCHRKMMCYEPDSEVILSSYKDTLKDKTEGG